MKSISKRHPRHMPLPDSRPGKKSSARRARLATVFFILGAVIFLYPVISATKAQEEAHKYVFENIEDINLPIEEKQEKEKSPAYDYFVQYNADVRNGNAGGINDPWGIGSNDEELSSIGINNGIIGTVSIPALHEEIPLYLGATPSHLNEGVGIISGTSVPLGEPTSNVVIAGHRGTFNGLPMFRDIEDLKLGDTLTIKTLDDTLYYEAIDTMIIDPNDTESIKIVPNKDLVMLLTCHPYSGNSSRYIVVFERIPEETLDTTEIPEVTGFANPITQAFSPIDSLQLRIERIVRLLGLIFMVVMPIVLFIERKK